MKCQILFSGKNKKNISKRRLLKILPRVLSVNLLAIGTTNTIYNGCLGHKERIKQQRSKTYKMSYANSESQEQAEHTCICRLSMTFVLNTYLSQAV